MRDFDHTVNVLVQAYLNGKLNPRDCAACAVGNIIADSMGYNIVSKISHYPGLTTRCNVWINKHGDIIDECWTDGFVSRLSGEVESGTVHYKGQVMNVDAYLQSVKDNGPLYRQIQSTGYTFLELARIEKAFELGVSSVVNNRFMTPEQKDAAQFAGLMAVVDVLAYIHGVDLSAKQAAKKLFVKEMA